MLRIFSSRVLSSTKTKRSVERVKRRRGNDWKKWGETNGFLTVGLSSRIALQVERLIALHLYELSAPSWLTSLTCCWYLKNYRLVVNFRLRLAHLCDRSVLFSCVSRCGRLVSWVGVTGSWSHEPRIYLQLAGLWTQKL